MYVVDRLLPLCIHASKNCYDGFNLPGISQDHRKFVQILHAFHRSRAVTSVVWACTMVVDQRWQPADSTVAECNDGWSLGDHGQFPVI